MLELNLYTLYNYTTRAAAVLSSHSAAFLSLPLVQGQSTQVLHMQHQKVIGSIAEWQKKTTRRLGSIKPCSIQSPTYLFHYVCILCRVGLCEAWTWSTYCVGTYPLSIEGLIAVSNFSCPSGDSISRLLWLWDYLVLYIYQNKLPIRR